MKAIAKRQLSKKPGAAKTMLQARVVYQDCNGAIHDVTRSENQYGFGLKALGWQAETAVDELIRVQELLKLLAIAAEKGASVDATLVQRVLEEVETGLSDSGELYGFVRHTKELFEEAEALPPVSAPDKKKPSRSTKGGITPSLPRINAV